MDAPLLPVLPGYEDPQLIAHGTTALVFRAKQTRLNRLVAIKVITAETGSIPVNAARELATTVALSSQPHIVSIIDTGFTEDDRPYIVMEYCEGGSYAQILRRGGPLPIDDVIEVGVKIGEALHAAHQVGIVHRDVKPSNILRSRFGPALTDFGIARAPDELGSTLTREMMTPHHASPEALLHQAQSSPSDVYSLASTLWTLLTGHPPFVDPTQPPVDMYLFRDRVLHDPVPRMERTDVPAWLLAELTRAMAKLPADRHATAFEFAEALRRGSLGLDPLPPPRAAADPPATIISRPVRPVPGPWGGAFTEPAAPDPEPPADQVGRPAIYRPPARPAHADPTPAGPRAVPPTGVPAAPAASAGPGPTATGSGRAPAGARPTAAGPGGTGSAPAGRGPESASGAASTGPGHGQPGPGSTGTAPSGTGDGARARPAGTHATDATTGRNARGDGRTSTPGTGTATPGTGTAAPGAGVSGPGQSTPGSGASGGTTAAAGAGNRSGAYATAPGRGGSPTGSDPEARPAGPGAAGHRPPSGGSGAASHRAPTNSPDAPNGPGIPGARAGTGDVSGRTGARANTGDASGRTGARANAGDASGRAGARANIGDTSGGAGARVGGGGSTGRPGTADPAQPAPRPTGTVYQPPARIGPVGGSPPTSGAAAGVPAPSALTDSWPAGRLTPIQDGDWPPPGEADGSGYQTRRFAETDLVPRPGIRPGLVVILVVVTLLALAATAVISLSSRGHSTPTPSAGGPSASTSPDGPPTGVRLLDRGTSVVLTWDDPAHGTVSFVIVGTGPNNQPLQVRQVPQGSTTVVYDGLSPTAKYCFRVGAIYAFNQVKPAPEVCTRR